MTEQDQTNQANPTQEDGAALLEPPSGGRVHFGRLTIYAKKVRLESGAEGYGIEGLNDFNGLPVKFVSKVPDEKSRTVHVVPVLTKTDQENKDYTVHQNLLSGSREYKRVFYKSLEQNVPNFAALVNTGAVVFVRVEEVPFADFYPDSAPEEKTSYIDREGDRVDRTVWRVAESFPSQDAMIVASDEFFAQFREGEGADGSESTGLGASPGEYNEQGWAGMIESITSAFNDSGDAVKVATDYAILDEIKAASAAGHTPAQIAASWKLPVPLVVQVAGSS